MTRLKHNSLCDRCTRTAHVNGREIDQRRPQFQHAIVVGIRDEDVTTAVQDHTPRPTQAAGRRAWCPVADAIPRHVQQASVVISDEDVR